MTKKEYIKNVMAAQKMWKELSKNPEVMEELKKQIVEIDVDELLKQFEEVGVSNIDYKKTIKGFNERKED